MSAPPLSAIEHYQTFLADYYTWMSGPYADKVDSQHDLLVQSGIARGISGQALDLGSGPGAQSIALARLGFSVTAVDANAQLLQELRQHGEGLPIRTVESDLCTLATCTTLPACIDVAVCLGDIIPHLPSKECITTLFHEVAMRLVPHGKFVLGFRDLSEERHGLDRFVPIRGDSERVMTCFLEYEPETVIVHDLIHTRSAQGWDLRKSCYRKLRLSVPWVVSQLEAQRLVVVSRQEVAGVWTLVATKA